MVLLALNYLALGSLFFSFYKEIACSFILFSFKLSLFTLAYFRLLGFYFFSFFIYVSSTCKNLLEALQWIISNSAVWKKILISIYYPPPPHNYYNITTPLTISTPPTIRNAGPETLFRVAWKRDNSCNARTQWKSSWNYKTQRHKHNDRILSVSAHPNYYAPSPLNYEFEMKCLPPTPTTLNSTPLQLGRGECSC